MQPSDADLKKYYDDNIAHYRTDGQVRASHILIAAPKDASAADKAKAKQKAEELLAQVKAHPDQFAQIAQQNSQDPGSASKGGDLGYFGRGMIAGGQAFDDAVFALKKDEVSGIVQTDFGYHIVKVTDVKPAVTKPFDEVKDQIAKDLKTQLAEQGIHRRLGRLHVDRLREGEEPAAGCRQVQAATANGHGHAAAGSEAAA